MIAIRIASRPPRKNRVGASCGACQSPDMSDYERVAVIIRYLDAHRLEQPGLDVLAAEAGLSPHQLHRLFTKWAAITPKDFLQLLTLESACRMLRDGISVLDTALETGLSGPGRLHDLCVVLESASPGEMKTGGAGWSLVAGIADSPFGPVLLAEGPRGICHLAFADRCQEPEAWQALKAHWPAATIRQDNRAAAGIATCVFEPATQALGAAPLRACVRGTAFQSRVWQALLEVPEGALTTYGRLAQRIGQPGAARAVGTAVGCNPLAYLIPCHRVIRETGVAGNYRWSPTRKRAMLVWEGARCRARD